ncbi:MAG: MFS transporter [Asgard group archaeon]|nr:MFS transporter [Asgard group archaeon]
MVKVRLELENKVALENKGSFLKFYFAIGLFSFGYNFITTAEYVHFRQIMVSIGFDYNDMRISILLGCALASLCIGAILGGIFNDAMRTKFGQRAPAIFLGSIITSILFLIIPIVTNFLSNFTLIFVLLLVMFIVSHIALGFAYSPWLALIVDLFPKNKRFNASIAINILSAGGAAIAVILFSALVDNNLSWIIWLIAGGIFGLSAIITTIIIPKNNPEQTTKMNISDIWKIPKTIWTLGGKEWILLLFIGGLWSFSSHLVEASVIDSLVIRFGVTDTEASLAANILMGVFIVILLIPIIWSSNRIGKIQSSIITCGIYGLFCLLLAIMPKFEWIYFIVLFGGIGNILLSTLQIVLPVNRVPKGKEASFLGVFFAFSTIMKPIATLLQGFLIKRNEYNKVITTFGGYPWIFLIAGIIVILTIIPLIFMINRKIKQKMNQIKIRKEKEEITL